MFPALFAVAAATTIGATCVAFVYNELSESERRAQRREREKQDELRRKLEEIGGATGADADIEALIAAHRDQRMHIIEARQSELPEIGEGIEKLFELVNSELAADDTSSARKVALRTEYRRIADASARLGAFRAYLENERRVTGDLFARRSYDELVNREIPQLLLPDEWLYTGKLVWVTHDEIGRKLPQFEQKLLFRGARDQQRALALAAGDEFPMLVSRQHDKNERVFFGCVARGRLELEHIRTGEPLEMEITSPGGRGHFCEAYGGLIRAQLPRSQMEMPGLKVVVGQRVQVYPTACDLTLDFNPFVEISASRRRLPIEVSEFPPQLAGESYSRDLYIEADSTLLDQLGDGGLFDENASFYVLGYDEASDVVTLGWGPVRLTCALEGERGTLSVTSVEECRVPQIGSACGFDFVLVPHDLDAGGHFGWPAGIRELRNQARSIARIAMSVGRRKARAQFLRRWQEILDYQLDHDQRATCVFDATPSQDRGGATLLIPSVVLEGDSNDGISPCALFDRVMDDERAVIERCCRLDYWDDKRSAFMPALRSNTARYAEYWQVETGIQVKARFKSFLLDGEVRSFRFRISQPHAPLDRQSTALENFFDDRYIEPKLKEALLSPADVEVGVGNASSEAPQFFASLNASQRAAVETALSSAPLSLIQGPPGTGKTTVIVEIIHQILERNPSARILVCSQQNAAVDNALERLRGTVRRRPDGGESLLRVGRAEKLDPSLTDVHIDARFEELTARLYSAGEAGTVSGDRRENAFARQWRDVVAQTGTKGYREDELMIGLLSSHQIVGATCVGLASRGAGTDTLMFDYAIIDEAGRSTLPELLIPLSRAKKAVLVGDHHQLPPSIAPLLSEDDTRAHLPFLRESFLDTSFFESLYGELPEGCKVMLDVQFRMPPQIGTLVSDLFYVRDGESGLANGECVHDREGDLFSESLVWVDSRGRQAREQRGTSLFNSTESERIVAFVNELAGVADRKRRGSESVTIAVITPYRAQVRRICHDLAQLPFIISKGTRSFTLGRLTIQVDTVDAFQGSEADVVCYSAVRTAGALSFVHDRRRLNVTCSRARRHLIIFGDQRFLTRWCPPQPSQRNLFAEIARRSTVSIPSSDEVYKQGRTNRIKATDVA